MKNRIIFIVVCVLVGGVILYIDQKNYRSYLERDEKERQQLENYWLFRDYFTSTSKKIKNEKRKNDECEKAKKMEGEKREVGIDEEEKPIKQDNKKDKGSNINIREDAKIETKAKESASDIPIKKEVFVLFDKSEKGIIFIRTTSLNGEEILEAYLDGQLGISPRLVKEETSMVLYDAIENKYGIEEDKSNTFLSKFINNLDDFKSGLFKVPEIDKEKYQEILFEKSLELLKNK